MTQWRSPRFPHSATILISFILEVVPVAYHPIDPLNAGARLIVINRDPTFLDKRADIIFRQDLVVVLPRLSTEVLGEQE